MCIVGVCIKKIFKEIGMDIYMYRLCPAEPLFNALSNREGITKGEDEKETFKRIVFILFPLRICTVKKEK